VPTPHDSIPHDTLLRSGLRSAIDATGAAQGRLLATSRRRDDARGAENVEIATLLASIASYDG
jgi:hypothetical protein